MYFSDKHSVICDGWFLFTSLKNSLLVFFSVLKKYNNNNSNNNNNNNNNRKNGNNNDYDKAANEFSFKLDR